MFYRLTLLVDPLGSEFYVYLRLSFYRLKQTYTNDTEM